MSACLAGGGGVGVGGGEWVCFWLLLEPTNCLSYLEDLKEKKKKRVQK